MLPHAIKLRYRYWFRLDERNLTILITTILILGLYFILNRIGMPEISFKTDKFEEIEFEKFKPPPPKPPDEAKPKEEVKREVEPLVEVPVQPAQIDFEILDNLDEVLAQQQDLLEMPNADLIPDNFKLPDIEVNTQVFDNALPTVQNQIGDIEIASANRKRDPNVDLDALGVKGDFNPAAGKGKRIGPVSLRAKQSGKADIAEIEPKDLDDKQINEALDKLFRELLDWLQVNHMELSPTLKAFLNYKRGDLTSHVKIQTADELYDLFIICTEESQDVGILLVKSSDNSVIYLRDVGFKRQSHYLSTGIAGRDGKGEVLTVGTREETPSREQTNKFYSIFLTWWEENKS